MSKWWTAGFLALAVLLASFGGRAAAQPQQVEPASAGIIVSLKVAPGQKPEASLKQLQSFASAKMSVKATQLISSTIDDQGLMVVPVPPGQSASDYAAQFTAAYTDSGVLVYAEPNWIIPAPAPIRRKVTAGTDPYRSQQWALNFMHIDRAWEMQSKAVVLVGFVDSGYDQSHEDLPSLAGWNDFTDARSSVPVDEMGHGTHTAGTVCAISNNSTGVAGIGNGCQVYEARVFNGPGTGAQLIWVIRGMDWLRESGVRIASLSLGHAGPWPGQAYTDAIKRFHNAGGLVIAAAGNDGKDEYFWPARFNGVISVASLAEPGNSLSGFSNRGDWVTIAAPGENILSTVPTWMSNPAYQAWDGTSMAAPQVTGVVALMRSLRPCLSHDQVVAILQQSARPLQQDGVQGALDGGAALALTAQVTCLYIPTAQQ